MGLTYSGLMNPYLKGSLHTLLFIVSSEILYQFFSKRKRLSIKKKTENESRLSSTSLQVLFFPDKQIACRDYFISGDGCFRDKCSFSHKDTSLSALFKQLMSCKVSLDVCVYVFTCKDLGDILTKLHKRRIRIRIITDSGQLQSTGSQIWKLRKEGIPVRVNKSSYFMHHKFAVVDGKILINGSFNWTHQAITGNKENVLITDDDAVTSLFVSEFQRLWEDFSSNE